MQTPTMDDPDLLQVVSHRLAQEIVDQDPCFVSCDSMQIQLGLWPHRLELTQRGTTGPIATDLATMARLLKSFLFFPHHM